MNRLQRAILIGIGLTIVVVQLVGIANHGLDDNKGWAVSLLIAAALLFFGSGTSFEWLTRFRKEQQKPQVPPPHAATAPAASAPARAAPAPVKLGKYDYGVHISELDIAIEAHKNYAERSKLEIPVQGNGRSLNWNCCVSVYSSIRLAALKARRRIHSGVWSTIVRGIVVRMSTEETKDIGMGDPGFEDLESAAYTEIERADHAVDAALSGHGEFLVQPITALLAQNFGTRTEEGLKALSAIILINAETAHKKILPEMLADLS